MANQFEPVINELKDKADKEGSKKLLFQEYKKHNGAARDEFVKELIHQMMEYKEKAEYLYLHYLNEEL